MADFIQMEAQSLLDNWSSTREDEEVHLFVRNDHSPLSLVPPGDPIARELFDDRDDLGLAVSFDSKRAKRSSPSAIWRIVLVGDLFAVLAAVLITIVASRLGPIRASLTKAQQIHILTILVFPLSQLLFFGVLGMYKQGRRLRPSAFSDFQVVLGALVGGTILGSAATYAIERVASWPAPPTADVVLVVASMVLFSILVRSFIYYTSRVRTPTRVLIVGSGTVANRVSDYLERDSGATVVGFVDDDPMPPVPLLGCTKDLPSLCDQYKVDRVLVSFTANHPKELTSSLRQLHGVVPIGIVPRYFELLTWRSEINDICGLPIIDVAPPSLGPTDRLIKRSFDIVTGVLAVLALWPLLLVIALAIKVTSKGPVFFLQDRIGRNGKPFKIMKFRSMQKDAESVRWALDRENELDGPNFKIRSDPRVTTVGRYLRKTSLDELPQLFNIIIGQMSVVGPRPFIPEEALKIQGWARRRFEVRPGLTGVWQVSGRNDLMYDDLQRLDYLYVASWSFAWDLKILLQTPATVLRGHGAY